jgi:catechol 2,3-dioxygenase-like lactoylglutathione lyase family enzyme
MPLWQLDHVNVVTANREEMVAWYEAVLGLRSGPRPDFPFDGAWLDCRG